MNTLETAGAAIEHLYGGSLPPEAVEPFTALWEHLEPDADAELRLLRAVEPFIADADLQAFRFRLPSSRDPWERRALLIERLDPWVLGLGLDPRQDYTMRPVIARFHAERQAALLEEAYAATDADALDRALEEWTD